MEKANVFSYLEEETSVFIQKYVKVYLKDFNDRSNIEDKDELANKILKNILYLEVPIKGTFTFRKLLTDIKTCLDTSGVSSTDSKKDYISVINNKDIVICLEDDNEKA